ncbi:hypothetical protein BAUCODRAFT_32583 [Baudoinia panamericana UAMH 10762]|uniref:Uncharacterized protein n=1 Tax=Baudoinia panamericana (strain UAMH 10762) TaxID=717646 RepID=M2NHM6_BAUPA|nr:uncharacterized protein BAUCODRAFT_32583 [Baudoinia panamericana UAMH 10762]EMC98530.1 hypothetical protein BAUCODRAFT_32583 [Baudoinia panamericana UAMH 10762]
MYPGESWFRAEQSVATRGTAGVTGATCATCMTWYMSRVLLRRHPHAQEVLARFQSLWSAPLCVCLELEADGRSTLRQMSGGVTGTYLDIS